MVRTGFLFLLYKKWPGEGGQGPGGGGQRGAGMGDICNLINNDDNDSGFQ